MPTMATVSWADGTASYSGSSRATRNTPAVTIVAAWISALTGLGPSIASGSQTCSGNCADLPIAPKKIRNALAVTTVLSRPPSVTSVRISVMSNVPVSAASKRMPMSSPTSPMRVVMNAFFAASAADRRSHQ